MFYCFHHFGGLFGLLNAKCNVNVNVYSIIPKTWSVVK